MYAKIGVDAAVSPYFCRVGSSTAKLSAGSKGRALVPAAMQQCVVPLESDWRTERANLSTDEDLLRNWTTRL